LFILFGFYFNGKIGTSEFTELAADTICRPRGKYFFVVVELQDVFGAKMDTNTAPLAPFRVYDMRL